MVRLVSCEGFLQWNTQGKRHSYGRHADPRPLQATKGIASRRARQLTALIIRDGCRSQRQQPDATGAAGRVGQPGLEVTVAAGGDGSCRVAWPRFGRQRGRVRGCHTSGGEKWEAQLRSSEHAVLHTAAAHRSQITGHEPLRHPTHAGPASEAHRNQGLQGSPKLWLRLTSRWWCRWGIDRRSPRRHRR